MDDDHSVTASETASERDDDVSGVGSHTTRAPEAASEALPLPASAAASTSHQPHTPRRLRVLVLVGLVGSGKSTFAKALCEYDSSYTRSSQDVLGSRQAVESHLLSLLSHGQSPVIDRTNVTVDQRSNWLRLALEWQKGQQVRTAAAADGTGEERHQVEVEVDAIFFQTGVEECARRLKGRVEHETIHSPEQALRVLNAFSSQLRPPSVAEGFHKILILHPSDFSSAEPSEVEVQRVLQRLEEAPASYEGGTRGALLVEAKRPGPRAPWSGDGRGRGRPYGWGALDRGRGGRGTPARGRGGNGPWRGDRGGGGAWRGDRGGGGYWRGRGGGQSQQTLPSVWGALPPAGAGLPPRPS